LRSHRSLSADQLDTSCQSIDPSQTNQKYIKRVAGGNEAYSGAFLIDFHRRGE
jgi:hypothetical protein